MRSFISPPAPPLFILSFFDRGVIVGESETHSRNMFLGSRCLPKGKKKGSKCVLGLRRQKAIRSTNGPNTVHGSEEASRRFCRKLTENENERNGRNASLTVPFRALSPRHCVSRSRSDITGKGSAPVDSPSRSPGKRAHAFGFDELSTVHCVLRAVFPPHGPMRRLGGFDWCLHGG